MHLVYDNSRAIEFIRIQLPEEIKNKLSDNEIEYVIDSMFEYFEDQGLLEDYTNEETIIKISKVDILSFIERQVTLSNKTTLSTKEISLIIQEELAYFNSLGYFEIDTN